MSKQSKDKENKLFQTSIPGVSAAFKSLELKTIFPQMPEVFRTPDTQLKINMPSVFEDLEVVSKNLRNCLQIPAVQGQQGTGISSILKTLESSRTNISSAFKTLESAQVTTPSILKDLEASRASIRSVFKSFEATRTNISSAFETLESAQETIPSVFEILERSRIRIPEVVDIPLQQSRIDISKMLATLEEPTELQTKISQTLVDLDESIIPDPSMSFKDESTEQWQQEILQRLESLEDTFGEWQADISQKLENLEELMQNFLLLFQRMNDANEEENDSSND